MSFLDFLLYDLILFIIKVFIILFCYRFFVKKKCNIFSSIAEKQIDDFWNDYDKDFDIDYKPDFVDTIHVIDDTENNTNSQEITRF